jgi:hypothetical protein
MAVTQISKIQIRRGLQENLPQLSSAEMGWSVDEQRLFIGNGTLAEGAPVTGVTEVLTTKSIYSELALIESLEGNVATLTGNVATVQGELDLITATFAVQSITFDDNRLTATNTAVLLSSLTSQTLDYTIVRGTTSRVGTIHVTQGLGTPSFQDDYSETASTGVVIGFVSNVSNVSNVTMTYTTTSIGATAEFRYYVKSFL